MRTSQKTPETITTIGIDLGKNTFHLVGLDKRGAIALQRKVSRSQLEHRLSNVPRCLIGMEACSGSHHIGRQLTALGHDVRLLPAQYVKPFLKGHKNDYRDAEAIAEAVQRPTMSFVAIKTPEQMDLLALHRVSSRLVGQRTRTINQIRGFLIERGIIVRQGVMPLRKALPDILSSNTNLLSPRMVNLIADLMQDQRWQSFSTFRGHCLLLEPEAGNGLFLFIEDWPRGDHRRKEDRRRKRTPLGHVYAVDGRGEKTAISARSFVIEVGKGMELKLDLAPGAPWASHVHIQTFDGPVEIRLASANVVQVSVAGGARVK